MTGAIQLNAIDSLRYYRDQGHAVGTPGLMWMRVVLMRAFHSRGIRASDIRLQRGRWQVTISGGLWVDTTLALNMRVMQETAE